VAAHLLEGSTQSPALATAIAAARRQWPRWEQEAPMLHCVVLDHDNGNFRLALELRVSELETATYDIQYGLVFPSQRG